MSYTPKTWNTGDTVTASDMNNIEQGIANAGVMVVEYDHSTKGGDNYYHYFDKTYAEVETALKNNIPVYYRSGGYSDSLNPDIYESSLLPIFSVMYDSEVYWILGLNFVDTQIKHDVFQTASNKNDYLCIYIAGGK